MSKKNRKKDDKFHGADRAFAERVARRTGAIVRETILPEGKISDIVCEYAEPLLDEFVETEQDHIDVLHLACMLWNMALMKRTDEKLYVKAESALMSVLADPPFMLMPAGALNLIGFMMRRWNAEFSWCSRIIVDKHIEIRGTQLHISVVTTQLPQLDKPAQAAPGREQECAH